MKRLKRIAALVLLPALSVLTCGLPTRRSPLLFTLTFMVLVAAAVIAVTVVVALRRE